MQLEKSVQQLEKRFALRVLRTLPSLRKRLTSKILLTALEENVDRSSSVFSALSSSLDTVKHLGAMDVDTASMKKKLKHTGAEPEVQLYFSLLVIVYLLDQKQHEKGMKLAIDTVALISRMNRRTADPIAASVYFYFSLFHELAGRLEDCLPILLAAHRTASLRRDVESEAVLINLLLRNYLHYNLYDQADKLAAKVAFPEAAGNNQLARYLFFIGRIKAVQLDYTASYKHLMQAIRKSPQSAAPGFLQTAYKFAIIVQLLMGEIPERSIFRQATLEHALIPYFHISQAVRVGDLAKFQQVLLQYSALFKQDKTFYLILRLRHNVIKTGIRMISLAYSRISLRDICIRLHLDSEEDAEYIVAKAIRDGVIDASIDHEHGYMQSKDIVDIYSTQEPQSTFHQRIQFCLNLYNESVKAMRYPETKQHMEFETADEMRNIETEIASMVEDMEDEF